MPDKHENTKRIGGPGASHENRQHPEKSKPRGPHPSDTRDSKTSGSSSGGGVEDRHHSHDPKGKGGH